MHVSSAMIGANIGAMVGGALGRVSYYQGNFNPPNSIDESDTYNHKPTVLIGAAIGATVGGVVGSCMYRSIRFCFCTPRRDRVAVEPLPPIGMFAYPGENLAAIEREDLLPPRNEAPPPVIWDNIV